MTYILVGPGLRDNVTLENLFPLRTVEQISPVNRVEQVAQSPMTVATEEHRHRQQRQAEQAYHAAAEPPREREQAVNAAQIMSREVVTVFAESELVQAWKLLEEHHFRHLPVLEQDSGKLIGMLTEHDFITSAERIGGLPPSASRAAPIRSVGQLMSSPILSATIDTDIHELARVMYRGHIGAVPILDSQGELAGIITHRDILKALVKSAPLELWI